MRLSRTLALGASMLVLLGACSTGGGSKPTVKVGSVGFDEARVVAVHERQHQEDLDHAADNYGRQELGPQPVDREPCHRFIVLRF